MRNEEADYSGTDRRWLPKIRWKGRAFSVRFGRPVRYNEIRSEDKLSALEDMILDLANE